MGIVREGIVRGAPDLVVEVLSWGSAARDRRTKKRIYAEAGVREFWLVDPKARTVEVFLEEDGAFRRAELYESDDRLTSKMLPGLQIDLQEVFAPSV